MKPLIGVTTSEMRRDETRVDPTKAGDPATPEMALGMPYLRAIEQAGGIPVVLPPVDIGLTDTLLDRLDGICLSGGPDIDPGAYGKKRHPELGPTEAALDEFEISVAREAVTRGLPVLAICRGAQVLNVALGGTLHQHLPEISDDIQHRQTAPGTTSSHAVRAKPGSKLRELLGDSESTDVNSFHHQAVDVLANGLEATAWAADGTIEGVEGGPGFVVGVQWHAETLVHRPEQLRLFTALVGAASATRSLAAA